MSTYTFSPDTKKKLFIAMAAGIVLFALGLLFASLGGGGHHEEGGHHGTDAHATHATEMAAHSDVTSKEAKTIHVDSAISEAHAEQVVTEVLAEPDTAHAAVGASADTTAAAPYVYMDVSSQTGYDKKEVNGHHDDHHAEAGVGKQILVSVYTAAVFLFFIALTSVFLLSGATVAYGGWHIQIQKIILSLSATFLVSIPLLVILWATQGHDLFHWMHEEVYKVGSPEYDAILATKHDYLNPTGFWIRAALLIGAISLIVIFWWKAQNRMDLKPSVGALNYQRRIAAVAVVVIAMVIDPFATWDWIMSIQPHWFSTLYPWYAFASAAVTMFSIVQLYIMHVQSKGLLPNVNANHRHDVGVFMFAITVFWTYLWFSQYMLIWYANIPEETIYFKKRLEGYKFLFYLSFILNFILPFFILMKRNAKRNKTVVTVGAALIIFGHFLDYFLMVGPEIVPTGGFGLINIGVMVFIGSIAAYVALTALSKVKDLESSTHPFYRENVLHHI